jgi:CRISPR-associated protein Cas1
VVQAFESKILELHDFYFTGNDYRYRFEPEAKRRFIDVLREQFNSGVTYKSRVLKWDTVIEQKTSELGRYLVGKSPKLDLIEPTPIVARNDSQVVRDKILQITQTQAEKVGIGRSTLHYLRKNARKPESFKIYGKMRQVLE